MNKVILLLLFFYLVFPSHDLGNTYKPVVEPIFNTRDINYIRSKEVLSDKDFEDTIRINIIKNNFKLNEKQIEYLWKLPDRSIQLENMIRYKRDPKLVLKINLLENHFSLPEGLYQQSKCLRPDGTREKSYGTFQVYSKYHDKPVKKLTKYNSVKSLVLDKYAYYEYVYKYVLENSKGDYLKHNCPAVSYTNKESKFYYKKLDYYKDYKLLTSYNKYKGI